MTDRDFITRAIAILHNMALERKSGGIFSRRWHISSEPLRNDAASLLREYGICLLTPKGCHLVGDTDTPAKKGDS